MKLWLLPALLFSQVAFSAPLSFLDYCLDPDITAAEETTVIAVMHAFKIWPERNQAGCEAANNMVLERSHLNLYPYPDQRPREKITDLKPIAGFKHLEQLTLSWNRVSDLSPLRSLQRLKMLNLWHNDISDVSPLADLAALQILYLSQNNVADLRPLSQLKQLTELTLAENSFRDLGPLTLLGKLKYLNVSANELTSIDVLAPLPSLEDLNAADNQISSLGAFKSGVLLHLDLQNNQLRDLRPFADLPSLQTLSLANNGLVAIDGLESLQRLRWLSLRGNEIRHAEVLGTLVNLKQLHINRNRLCPIPDALHALATPHQGTSGQEVALSIDGLDDQVCGD